MSSPPTAATDTGSEPDDVRPSPRLPFALRRPRWVLVLGLLFLIVTGALAGGASSVLKNGGFDDPNSDSAFAANLIAQKFPAAQPNLVLVVRNDDGPVDTAAETGRRVLATLAGERDAQLVGSYFAGGDPSLRSKDGHSALTLVHAAGDEDAVGRTTSRLHDRLAKADGPVTVRFGGLAQINNDLTEQTDNDVALSELIALPLTLILLFFVFRGLIAALLPVLVGVLSISGSLAFLYGLGQTISVSVFSVNLITALGLGLAVDYSLLIVSRYREERSRGLAGPEAILATLRTAGRTVIFSGVIVAAVLTTLLVFRQYFLSSFAYAGVAVVAITLLCVLFPLPAALLLLGDRIDKWSFAKPRPERPAEEDRMWGRIAGATMRRPGLFGLLVVVLLAVLAVPIFGAQFGVPDERALPQGTESRVVTDVVRTQFTGDTEAALSVVSPDWPGGSGDLAGYAAKLSEVPHVTGVASAAGQFVQGRQVGPAGPGSSSGGATLLQVNHDVEPFSTDGEQLVQAVRAVPVPGDHRVAVGGLPAQYLDVTASIGDRLPLGVGLAALLTFLLLGAATGSILLPIKAVVCNVLGLLAVLGAMVWVFQDGHLADLFGVTPAPIAVTIPVLLLVIAYALSMDYEMFLLSRIKESFDETGDPVLSVRKGLGGSGPIISAAAAILAVSFFSTAISGVSLAKLFGIGTGLAVLVDALLIRGVLVPAFLKIAGRAAWWVPPAVQKLTDRISGTVGHR
ncbi:MMPL family transporter [Amycolatopsis panacis]|uniref:MMPL family transporter n=1 Tax=Amycolatopsis panacis TaxID=2340917 RepID=A0A419HWC0_9PSEU|nr:MMPL family transporter [Amycolatopsis panacis]RJQ81319.1 MMPL family transporter [Amycolatopsis panacis]